jgi:NifU-like protein involved in Fe-S cluster formation
MSDSDLITLYSGRILELACAIPLQGRLSAPQATARKRSPICGSVVTVDLVLRDGRVTCALGQASAAVLGAVVIGRTPAELRAARDGLQAMLTQNAPPPPAPFDGYQVLIPAREYRNRHASILLALQAICEAAEAAEIADKTAAHLCDGGGKLRV